MLQADLPGLTAFAVFPLRQPLIATRGNVFGYSGKPTHGRDSVEGVLDVSGILRAYNCPGKPSPIIHKITLVEAWVKINLLSRK